MEIVRSLLTIGISVGLGWGLGLGIASVRRCGVVHDTSLNWIVPLIGLLCWITHVVGFCQN